MGILDGIVEWIAKQVMNGLDLISTSVLGALGCDMGTFLRYFPAAETMYKVFVATAIGLVLLFEAAERYVLLGVVVYTAPMAFATGASQSTSNIFKSWCRMFGGQIFLLMMNAWCLRLFTSMVGSFLSNPLSL
jgi:uncharacterized membrane protein YeaQ/YmgE (transglycosylase-associated protein family)